MNQNTGKIIQIIGAVVDVSFDNGSGELPMIYDSLEVVLESKEKLVLECQQHIGEKVVRTIAMESTDGLQRGMEVIPTGKPITMPKGELVLGRLLNVTGDAIDGMESLPKEGRPIHSDPPKYEELTTEAEVLHTGIKVIDLIEPYERG